MGYVVWQLLVIVFWACVACVAAVLVVSYWVAMSVYFLVAIVAREIRARRDGVRVDKAPPV